MNAYIRAVKVYTDKRRLATINTDTVIQVWGVTIASIQIYVLYCTETTKSRLEELEKKKIDLQIKIEYEQSQDRLAITENDIKYYLLSALKKAPRLMIDALINKIILYNDKTEIYLKYTNRKSPDDKEDHQDFLFYVTSRSYEIDKKSFGGKIYIISYKVSFGI